MRGLASLVIVAGIMLGIYHFYFKEMPTTDPGTAPTQAINLTGVRMDLLQIAQSERTFTAQNGRCASLDELTSSNAITMSRASRDGYSYSVQCAGNNFTITGSHAAAPADSPIRYPALAIDQTMQVTELN
jgi:hypothetical protein